jgi:hypothetical protein
MMESPAYIALGGSARKVLDRLEIEIAHHAGNDNGKLPCTYEHFVEYGVNRHAVGPARGNWKRWASLKLPNAVAPATPNGAVPIYSG